jgi:hypothetical protein
MIAKMERNAPWLPLLGITTRVPARPTGRRCRT